MRFVLSVVSVSLFALSAPALAQITPQLASPDSGPPAESNIVVTGRLLDAARDSIQPSLGASEFKLDRTALDKQPGGADNNLTTVLLQAPGVTQDSYGQVHVRNEHGNLQYRLNGVIVPESISGFGQTFDPRIADSIDLVTGTLPAQYGYRTSGVVSLKTQTSAFENGGEIGFRGGSNGTIQPSASLKGASGGLNYFFSGSYLENDLGVENPIPTRTAIHDRTRQYRAFGYLSDILTDSSRLTLFGGTAIGHFQIPNLPGETPAYVLNGRSTFDSSQLDQNQREITHYGVLAYEFAGNSVNFEIAPFIRYSQTRFTPDPQGGDLIFNGSADSSRLSSLAIGLQADGSERLSDAHMLRFGLFFQSERTRSLVVSRVFPVDPISGLQSSDIPETISASGSKIGQLYGAYVQDEWTLSPTLTLNYGVRFDAVRSFVREQQASPRVNLVWRPTPGTTVHAGYARNFTPPPQELVTASVDQFDNTTRASQITSGDPVHSEREHYFDAGVQQLVAGGLTVALDGYYKIKRNLLDDGQFGSSLVLSPFNYARGYAWGVELSADYHRGPIALYANVARGQEKGRNIISSQFFFDPGDLAYIADHYIYTDHSQFWTASGGGSVVLHNALGELVPSGDLLYGDGLRADDPSGIVPNGGKLPSYVTVNFGIAQKFAGPSALAGMTLRVDVVNAFDKSYLIRDGSGIGVGAPQWGARRGFFASISKRF